MIFNIEFSNTLQVRQISAKDEREAIERATATRVIAVLPMAEFHATKTRIFDVHLARNADDATFVQAKVWPV